MARKETIYSVNKETNIIVRASRTYLAACEFAATKEGCGLMICTSAFQDLKKGDAIAEVVDIL